MPVLSDMQVEAFDEKGYVLVDNALDGFLLARLRDTLAEWIGDAASRIGSHGETMDGRARFDVEQRDDSPSLLRRVNNPVEVSDAYFEAAFEGTIPDMVCDLIGPDVKYHHSKINLKLPGSSVEVKYHQDFPYTPHSNADIVTVLLLLDDMTEENGCLMVLPGSHRGEIHSLWHEGRFTGAVADSVVASNRGSLRPVTGSAGTACLMHTRLLHGSAVNSSDRPRSLFIPVYSAADAVPLAPSPVPSAYQGRIVRGTDYGRARMEPLEVQLPETYGENSFFAVQERAD